MRVGEAQTFIGEAVEVRRRHTRRAVAAGVALAEVVGVEQDDVGPVGGGRGRAKNDEQEKAEGTHGSKGYGV